MEILQATILEQVAICSSRVSSQPGTEPASSEYPQLAGGFLSTAPLGKTIKCRYSLSVCVSMSWQRRWRAHLLYCWWEYQPARGRAVPASVASVLNWRGQPHARGCLWWSEEVSDQQVGFCSVIYLWFCIRFPFLSTCFLSQFLQTSQRVCKLTKYVSRISFSM